MYAAMPHLPHLHTVVTAHASQGMEAVMTLPIQPTVAIETMNMVKSTVWREAVMPTTIHAHTMPQMPQFHTPFMPQMPCFVTNLVIVTTNVYGVVYNAMLAGHNNEAMVDMHVTSSICRGYT